MLTNISTEEFYDKFADNYDDTLKSSKVNAQQVNEAVKLFHRCERNQGSILDIGCGTGNLSEFLQGDFEYTGIDISGKMLDIAARRGYKTIHKPIETALAEIDTQSFDFVFCLCSLTCVEDAATAIEHMRRIARKTILFSLDEITEEFKKQSPVPIYDHSKIPIKDAIEDYFILGWTSPSTGIPVHCRMIYIEQES
ncbi:MAG: class I SAM-dependent methyltransferase [Cyanobacteria bacterium P01_D01_bin.116]